MSFWSEIFNRSGGRENPQTPQTPGTADPAASPAPLSRDELIAVNRQDYLKTMLSHVHDAAQSYALNEHVDRFMDREEYTAVSASLKTLERALETNNMQGALSAADEATRLVSTHMDRRIEGMAAVILERVPEERRQRLGLSSPADLADGLRNNPDVHTAITAGRAGTPVAELLGSLPIRQYSQMRGGLFTAMGIAAVPASLMDLTLPAETPRYVQHTERSGINLDLIAGSDYDDSFRSHSLLFLRGAGEWVTYMGASPGYVGDGLNFILRPEEEYAGYEEWKEAADRMHERAWSAVREDGIPEPELPGDFAAKTAGTVTGSIVGSMALSAGMAGAGHMAANAWSRGSAFLASHADDAAAAASHSGRLGTMLSQAWDKAVRLSDNPVTRGYSKLSRTMRTFELADIDLPMGNSGIRHAATSSAIAASLAQAAKAGPTETASREPDEEKSIPTLPGAPTL